MKDFEGRLHDFVNEMQSIFHQAIRTLESKRRTYGEDNLTKFGRYGILVRSSDKIEQLVKMYENGTLAAADGESERDAWSDLMCYAALAIRDIDLDARRLENIAKSIGVATGEGMAAGINNTKHRSWIDGTELANPLGINIEMKLDEFNLSPLSHLLNEDEDADYGDDLSSEYTEGITIDGSPRAVLSFLSTLAAALPPTPSGASGFGSNAGVEKFISPGEHTRIFFTAGEEET